MFDFGFESVSRFDAIAYYGPVWIVEFRDYTRVVVIEDLYDSPSENYILTEDEK